MINTAELETVTRNFIIAAVWADAPEQSQPRITRQAKAAARAFCAAFITENRELYNAAMEADGYGWDNGARNPAAQFGHDLYLAQAGHGAGFWDRAGLAFTPAGKADTLGNLLTEQCGHGTRFYGDADFSRGWMYFNWYDVTPVKAAA